MFSIACCCEASLGLRSTRKPAFCRHLSVRTCRFPCYVCAVSGACVNAMTIQCTLRHDIFGHTTTYRINKQTEQNQCNGAHSPRNKTHREKNTNTHTHTGTHLKRKIHIWWLTLHPSACELLLEMPLADALPGYRRTLARPAAAALGVSAPAPNHPGVYKHTISALCQKNRPKIQTFW